ncbi:MAG: hypothetical protein RI885_1830 [Actinomycetota bacterium]
MEERLFSLVLALLATETGLTKNEILSTVQGYRQRFDSGGDNANLERQFERDKDDIRDLGVPLDTVESPGQAGNNHILRYRIPRDSYELPSDIAFSAEETTLLNLAAMVWREGSMSTESRRALLKLRSLGAATEEPVLGYASTVRVRDEAFEPLSTALERRKVVRFAYLKPGETEAGVRTVRPLALVQHRGRWLLSAQEADTDLRKTFLLRRIVSAVTTTGRTFAAPTDDEPARALRELDEVWESRTALVEVFADSDAATRLLKRRGTVSPAPGTLEVHYSDLAIVADELASFGPEVLVVGPPAVRSAVRARLSETAAAHRPPEPESAEDPTGGARA